MRLGSNVKYSHTKEEMISLIKSINLLSHIHEISHEALVSHCGGKIYYHNLYTKEYIDLSKDSWGASFAKGRRAIEIELYHPSSCLEQLIYEYGAKCQYCEDIFNKQVIDGRYNNPFAFSGWRNDLKDDTLFEFPEARFSYPKFCHSCNKKIEDSINWLIFQKEIQQENLCNFTCKDILTFKEQCMQLKEVEKIIRLTQKQIREKKKKIKS